MPVPRITLTIHIGYHDVFSGIGCFKGMFPLQVKEGTKLPGLNLVMAYALEEPSQERTRTPTRKQIFVPLGVMKQVQQLHIGT